MERIWLSSPHMSGDEIKFIHEAIDSNWVAPLGPHVQGFEEDLCRFTGSKFAAALSSGTAAIHLALNILGVDEEDEVLCPTFTFAATCNPIIYQKARPVFVDSEPDTWNMDPVLLEEAIINRLKHGKKPKAIIAVHLYGMPAKLNEVQLVAKRYNIPLIEDAAEALGSKYFGRALGTIGDIGIFSFNGNKIITTSGGGALLSNNEAYVKRAKFLSEQARDPAPHYQHSVVGYNYRLSNICAAIGRGQMKVLEDRIRRRRAIYELYLNEFSKIEEISFLPEPEGFHSNRWLTCILVNENKGNVSYEQIRQALEKENIDSRPLWKPMHLQPVYKEYPFYGNGTSEELFNKGLCLPSGSNLTDDQLNRIIKIIKNFYY